MGHGAGSRAVKGGLPDVDTSGINWNGPPTGRYAASVATPGAMRRQSWTVSARRVMTDSLNDLYGSVGRFDGV